MNIKDVKNYKLPSGDKLDLIFKYQRELAEKYKKMHGIKQIPINIDTKEGQKIIREFAEYVVEELMEAMNCLRNKPWVKTETETDKEHFFEELCGDVLHFLVELYILCGIDSNKLFEYYFKKKEVNLFRIRSDY